MRRAFRRIWRARGGGLYATGFFVTFIGLEARMLVGEAVEAAGVGDFVGGQLAELVLRYSVGSLQNTVMAFFWPVWLMSWRPPLGVAALAALYALFPLTLKRPVERWLFDGPLPDPAGDGVESSSAGGREE